LFFDISVMPFGNILKLQKIAGPSIQSQTNASKCPKERYFSNVTRQLEDPWLFSLYFRHMLTRCSSKAARHGWRSATEHS